VVGEALTKRRGNRIQLGRKTRKRRGGRGVGHLGQQHQATLSLYQHTHRGLVAGALDEVAFPVAGHDAIVHLGRAHMDADHVGDLTAPIFASRAGHAGGAAMAQAGYELLTQLSPRLRVDRRIDGLVRDVPLRSSGNTRLRVAAICCGDHFQSSSVRTVARLLREPNKNLDVREANKRSLDKPTSAC